MSTALIAGLHARACKMVLAITGGGVSAAAALLQVPGGSRTILEVLVPYNESSLTELLGRVPTSFCSPETALAMAQAARGRAEGLVPGERVAGIGVTASLASDRPKRGDHRFHLAIDLDTGVRVWSMRLLKGARTRLEEESLLCAIFLNILAEIFEVSDRLPVPLLEGEHLEQKEILQDDDLSRFLRGEQATVCLEPDGRTRSGPPWPQLLLPGSFNPLHEGHRGLARCAETLTGQAVAFELSIANVDKPPLTAEEVRRRATQFAWQRPLWLTRAPTFREKGTLFPHTTFVVGADTAERIVSPRYYENREEKRDAALTEIQSLGGRFLVAGRLGKTGQFETLADLPIPPTCKPLFEEIPAQAFRADVSSTTLRGKGS